MACAWENERKEIELCTLDIGDYVYMGTPEPDFLESIVVVSSDLSGFSVIELTGGAYIPTSIYSKQGNLYGAQYDTVPNPDVLDALFRYSLDGTMAPLSGFPTGLSVGFRDIVHAGGKLRAINTNASWTGSLYESDDGEVWSLLPGSTTFDNTTVGHLEDYTVFSGRIVAASTIGGTHRLYYSNNGGSTWTGATGATGTGAANQARGFIESGSNLIAYARSLYVSSDGVSFTQVVNFSNEYYAFGPLLAASGSGLVVARGFIFGPNEVGFAYSSNHGASWSFATDTAAGVPGFSISRGMFWDGSQFVMFLDRDDNDNSQIYTSPTGAVWTAGIILPDVQFNDGNLHPVMVAN